MGKNEAATATRDRFNLSRSQLLADYAAISARRRGAAEAGAIRHQSVQYLDILATEATSGELDWSELRETLWNSMRVGLDLEGFQFIPLAEIGRIILLNPFVKGDQEIGLYILENAISKLPANGKTRKYRLLVLQRQVQLGKDEEALSLLEKWPDLQKTHGSYLETEIKNPFRFKSNSASQEVVDDWLLSFNKPLAQHGLSPVALIDDDGEPFDRLTVTETPKIGEGASSLPLVSVVLTTFQPREEQLLTSVQSILRQSYENLELIIVDDASGPDYKNIFDKLNTLDSRIKIVSLEKNVGTYGARNVGIKEARGKYFTGQDDDDWSHSERLVHQVRFLEAHPESAGCRVSGFSCLPGLVKLRLGYNPQGPNSSSLMVKVQVAHEVGGFNEWRKAADTEIVKRIERIYNATVTDLPLPLTMIRIRPEGLSRSEFRVGWSHPSRRQIKSSYAYWHSTAAVDDLRLSSNRSAPVYVPRRFRKVKLENERFHVVFAGDWRHHGGPQKSMIEEIKALTGAGYSIAVMHLEAPRFMDRTVKHLHPVIQGMINEGVVEEVLYDDEIDVDLLILRYPPILQFVPNEPSRLRVQKMFILANQAPSELDGSDIRYLVRDCMNNALRSYCENVTWVPQGPQVREAIEGYLLDSELEDFDIPGIVALSEWQTSIPRRRRGLIPVVGRHSRDNAMKWPEDKETLLSIYPADGSFDFRVMGGGIVPSKVLDSSLPFSWTVFSKDAMSPNAFLRTLDFFVFFQHSNAVEAFGRAVLEAVATNLVVILPRHFEDVFGDSAIYCEPADVKSVVARYYNNEELYKAQQTRALKTLNERFSYEAYVRRISQYISSIEKDNA